MYNMSKSHQATCSKRKSFKTESYGIFGRKWHWFSAWLGFWLLTNESWPLDLATIPYVFSMLGLFCSCRPIIFFYQIFGFAYIFCIYVPSSVHSSFKSSFQFVLQDFLTFFSCVVTCKAVLIIMYCTHSNALDTLQLGGIVHSTSHFRALVDTSSLNGKVLCQL